MKHYKYLSYLLRHKWFVMLECWKKGLFWAGITHDMSKFFRRERLPYTNFFYGGRLPDGTPPRYTIKDFRYAWLYHQNKNPHHWQYWVLKNDSGLTLALPMPVRFAVEMVCDWRGVSRALYGEDRTRSWYMKNRNLMKLHWTTRKYIHKELGLEHAGSCLNDTYPIDLRSKDQVEKDLRGEFSAR
jgi:hypothetical protein